jgi:hypothetical protein
MGHTRLGSVPKTRKWLHVLQLVAGKEGLDDRLSPRAISEIASQTLDAAEEGLTRAIADPGVQRTFYVLATLAAASAKRAEGQQAQSIFELAATVHDEVDIYLRHRGSTTDFGEMAQRAAGDALISVTERGTSSLFGDSSEEVERALRRVSTKAGFADLGEQFFSRFMHRFLNFYLSRVTARKIGSARVTQVGDISEFNAALELHCHQTARIVRDFCGDWYSKTNYLTGINEENASAFLAVAIKKLKAELQYQRTTG